MAEYTYKDVIIDPNDPRVEIGKEYYCSCYPSGGLNLANMGIGFQQLVRVDKEDTFSPFVVAKKDDGVENYPCLIRKKEPEKKYVPLDLNDREDVFDLMGSWLMNKTSGSYHCVITIKPAKNLVYIDGFGEMNPEELLEGFMFVFNDSPCGKLVEEE